MTPSASSTTSSERSGPAPAWSPHAAPPAAHAGRPWPRRAGHRARPPRGAADDPPPPRGRGAPRAHAHCPSWRCASPPGSPRAWLRA
ncbi:MAG: hypothetical protein ACK55Z_32150, partial [bacterium]